MPHHSTLDLLANSVSSQPFKASQLRAESVQLNKRVTPVSYRNFWTIRRQWNFPKILSMCLIVGSALFVNKICILFQKKKTINLKPNSLRTHIDLEEDWFPYQAGQTFCQTDQWYFPVRWRRTQSQIWNLEPSSMPTLSACNIIRIYSKVEDYKIKNKTCVDTEYEWEKMAAVSTSTSSRY